MRGCLLDGWEMGQSSPPGASESARHHVAGKGQDAEQLLLLEYIIPKEFIFGITSGTGKTLTRPRFQDFPT